MLFSNSLTGQAFTWYTNVPSNSINCWAEMEEKIQTHFSQANLRVLMVDLAKMKQQPGETIKQFITRFKKENSWCLSDLPEIEFVKLAQDGLNFNLRKKFIGITFFNLFKLFERATQYETILREENHWRNVSYGTYYQDPNYEVDLTEFVS